MTGQSLGQKQVGVQALRQSARVQPRAVARNTVAMASAALEEVPSPEKRVSISASSTNSNHIQHLLHHQQHLPHQLHTFLLLLLRGAYVREGVLAGRSESKPGRSYGLSPSCRLAAKITPSSSAFLDVIWAYMARWGMDQRVAKLHTMISTLKCFEATNFACCALLCMLRRLDQAIETSCALLCKILRSGALHCKSQHNCQVLMHLVTSAWLVGTWRFYA